MLLWLQINIVSNVGFKLSASSSNWRGFLSWQVVGNLAGLITVLTLTWLLRYISLHVAYSVVTGRAVVGVQVVAAGQASRRRGTVLSTMPHSRAKESPLSRVTGR